MLPPMPEVTGPLIGVGIDLVELEEFAESVLRRPSIAERVFTERELADCEGPQRIERLGARFAAKEATFKAAGTGWARGVTWHDAEVISRPGKAPELLVRGELERAMQTRGGSTFRLSLTHSGGYAAAISVLVDA